jgi:hypothetical protein
MKKKGSMIIKNLRYFCLLGVVALGLMTIVGTGGSGGDGGGGSDTTVTTLSNSDFSVNSGLTDGGVARTGTQTMTGTIPNPTGSTTSYGGKAYLVLNGDRIPLSVTSSRSRSIKTISKEGKEYYLDNADAVDFSVLSKDGARNDDTTWVFAVTFSINAGPNTIRIEVYDLNDTIFARTDQWDIVGTIEPTSLVITLWWNTNLTDIDLHVSPDDGVTHCYYANMTAGDMVLDYDDVNGYGPEHVTVNEVTGTKTYKIKVYYYYDHHKDLDPEDPNYTTETTATTANITAAVSGETKLSASHLMTVESTSSSWGTGSHIWDVGELEVSGADVYSVTLSDPDLTAFPTVQLTVGVTDSDSNPVEGLTSANFYVVNAGTAMSPVTVTGDSSPYTLTYADITSGARDLYVYVYVPAEGDTPMKGGLSNTKTYGTNYALLVGLNEYPAATVPTDKYSWFDEGDAPRIRVTVSKTPDGAGDFTATFTDTEGGTGRDPVSVVASVMIDEGGGTYKLSFAAPANYLDYDTVSLKYKKQIWLSWCVADITDVETALKAKGTLMDNSSWVDANIHTLTNSGATKTAIFNTITEIANGMEKYDLFLFHFSGHGSGMPADGVESQYLCAYEDDAWISVSAFSTKLGEIPNPGSNITNAFVMMDACHSGNFIGKDMNFIRKGIDGTDLNAIPRYRPFIPQRESETPDFAGLAFSRDLRDLTGTNLFVMSAVTGSKSAWDVGALENGVFTYYLVEGINTTGKYLSAASANADNDIWVTGEEAFSYLEPKAKKYVEDNILPTNPGASQDAQYWPDLTTKSRLIYNW